MRDIRVDKSFWQSEEMQKQRKEANLYITNALRLNEEEMTKEELVPLKMALMEKIRLVVSSELGIDPSGIQIKVRKSEGGESVNAFWTKARREDYQKDGVYGTIGVYGDFLETSSMVSFMEVMLHEFGHVRQSLQRDSGQDVSNGFKSFNKGYNRLESILFGVRSDANDGEYDADMFALSKIRKWIIEARGSGIGGIEKTASRLFKNIEKTATRTMKFVVANEVMLAGGLVDAISGAPIAFNLGMVFGSEDLYKRNVMNESRGLRTLDASETYIKSQYKKAHLGYVQKLRILDSMAVIFASELGIDPIKMGSMVLGEKGKGLAYYDINPSGENEDPLRGFVGISKEMFSLDGKEYLEQLRGYFKELEEKMQKLGRLGCASVGELGSGNDCENSDD